MKRFRFFCTGVSTLCCYLILTAPVFAQEWSAAQKEVWKTVELMWELSSKGNIDAELAYADEDLSLWVQNTPLPSGKASFRKWMTFSEKSGGRTLIHELTPITIKVFMDFAFVHYYVASVYQDTPTTTPEYGTLRVTDIFRKKGDRWIWVGGHNSNVPQKW